ncbi:MAG TPA: glycosyl transferase [Bacillota bacterium]
MTSMTSREFELSAVAILQKTFAKIIPEGSVCDALFVDTGFNQVIGIAALPFSAPVTLQLFKDPGLADFLNQLLQNHHSLLILNQEPIRVFTAGSEIEAVRLPEAICQILTDTLASVVTWGGELNHRGEHIINLKAPEPGPHYFVNLLLGNRIGYPYPLQTTPKSVVDRLGRGSFRSHAGTQVLATRWDMRQEENGFPANRQFYLVEKGKKLFYSADPNDARIETASCVHSQNHTVITYWTGCGLEISRTIFLLPQEPGLPLATEVQRINIKNQGTTTRRIRLVYTGMFGSSVPGAFQVDVLYSNIIMQAKLVTESNGDIKALGVDYYPERDRGDLRFHSTVIHQGGRTYWPREFVTNYNEFVGNGTLENPEGLYRLSNRLNRKGPGFFGVATELELTPGEECLVDNFTGLVSKQANPEFSPTSFEKELHALLDKYAMQPANLNRALEEVKSFYHHYRGFLQLKTATAAVDAYFNYNLPFQVLYQTFVSRSFCQTQKGYREIGFREIQDIFASMYYFVGIGKGDFVKSLLKEWCSKVFEFGYAYHNFFWVGKEPGKWSDDALWFIQALARYVHLTGDLGILDEDCAIAGTDPVRSRPVYETVKAILRYSGAISVGKHGLPLLDMADWNDCLQLDTDFVNGIQKEELYRQQLAEGGTFGEPFQSDYSESVMNAFLLKVAITETIWLAEAKNDGAYRAELENLAERLYRNLQEHAWKGNFFARVLFNRKDSEFSYLGAKGDGFAADPALDGTYFLNSFSWSILSDTATEAQIGTMLEVVEKELKTPYGLKLMTRADLSKVSKNTATGEYFPGDRENGAVFKHASMMAVAAMLKAAKQVKARELAARLAGLAYWMIDLTIPAHSINNPYLICGNPRFCTQYNNSETGENIGPMLSGTSTWLTLSIMSACGLEFTRKGLTVDPILKPDQTALEYRMRLADTVYQFRILKPEGFYRVADGTVRVSLDSTELTGNVIPLLNDGREHEVVMIFEK